MKSDKELITFKNNKLPGKIFYILKPTSEATSDIGFEHITKLKRHHVVSICSGHLQLNANII